jgi:hypothetical protein
MLALVSGAATATASGSHGHNSQHDNCDYDEDVLLLWTERGYILEIVMDEIYIIEIDGNRININDEAVSEEIYHLALCMAYRGLVQDAQDIDQNAQDIDQNAFFCNSSCSSHDHEFDRDHLLMWEERGYTLEVIMDEIYIIDMDENRININDDSVPDELSRLALYIEHAGSVQDGQDAIQNASIPCCWVESSRTQHLYPGSDYTHKYLLIFTCVVETWWLDTIIRYRCGRLFANTVLFSEIHNHCGK